MTIKQAIEQVDAQAHNSATEGEKRRWLSTLDGLALTLIHGAGAEFGGYDDAPDQTGLKIPAPFDDVYLHYLEAKIHYQNGDFARFNNANAMFTAAWQRYAASCLRENAGGKYQFF